MKNKIQSAVKSGSFALASALGLSFAACVAQAAATVTQTTTTASDGSGDTVVTFTIPAGSTESGTTTWTVPAGVTSIRYLVVGGGGGGGGSSANNGGGGGGAGAVRTGTVAVSGGDSLGVVVGVGGSAGSGALKKDGTATAGGTGGSSSLTHGETVYDALGGGGGGKPFNAGLDGGCGGGGGAKTGTAGAALASSDGNAYGNVGGAGATIYYGNYTYPGAGGGGASLGGDGKGGNPVKVTDSSTSTSSAKAGDGGDGVVSAITGLEIAYGGGGGGGASKNGNECTPGKGGNGGGGDGYWTSSQPAGAGVDGLGGGGGGAGNGTYGTKAARGGNGVVIVRYSAPTPITGAEVTFTPASYTYAAEVLAKPTVTVKVGNVTLNPSSDYSVSWDPSTMRYANDYTATITGKGSYTGEETATFYVNAASITAVQLASSSATYDGQPHEPVVASVTANGKTLTLGQDDGCQWTVAYKRNGVETDDFTSAGEIMVEVTGNTSLTGTASAIFTIVGATPEPDPDWGWSNRVTIAGTDYCVLAFTNTTTHTWTVPTGVTSFDYLVIGGGGGGGGSQNNNPGGGGGAGGVATGTVAVASSSALTITVGAGGAGGTGGNKGYVGKSGEPTTLGFGTENLVEAYGGGGGGGYSSGVNGVDGGSGGGVSALSASTTGSGGTGEQATCKGAFASGIVFGNNGGSYLNADSRALTSGGGGGGATSAGDGPTRSGTTVSLPGAGGVGLCSAISGNECWYAGGGGGGNHNSTDVYALGGSGIGGNGGNTSLLATDGAAATGSGGGGGGNNASGMNGGNGGSGIVIIRYAVGESKVVVPVPDAVSKPYTGEPQLSGLGETTYYTVSNPADAVNAGEYVVTLTLKDPLKYRFANGGEGSTTVQFTITRAANYWIANPQLDPTYWYVGDTVALAEGEAKFGEATKTITWYDKSGAVIGTGADAMPTAVGEYTLKIAVPADDAGGNWSGIEYAIGFIIYEPLGVTQVGVPVLPDKEYTGATQTADIPDSPLWTVTANAGGVNAGNYTATLQLKDKTKYTWRKADGSTTPDDQEITWHITKAKNRWTTEPKVYLTSDTTKAAIFSCAVNTPVSIANGTPRFGTVEQTGSIAVSKADTYLLNFTVPGTDNYEALTYELAFQVGPTSPGTEGTDTVTYQWARNASGEWTIPDMWTASTSDVGYPYCTTAGRAIAKFDSLSKELSGSTTDYPVEVHFFKEVSVGKLETTSAAASDITINGHRYETSGSTRYFGTYSGSSICSLSVANSRLTLMDGNYEFLGADSSVADGSTLCLRNSKHLTRTVRNLAALGTYDFHVYNKKLTLAGTARIEMDDAAAYLATLTADGGWTMDLRNQSLMLLNAFRQTSASKGTYSDRGWKLDIDNSFFASLYSLYLGCGTTDSYCSNPQISIRGQHGELFANSELQLGSDNALAQPLTVKITYPGGPFSWGGFVWRTYANQNAQADLKIGAPIGAAQSLTIGSNARFVIDITDWAAAAENLVTVPICCANVSRSANAYYLNVPGTSGGKLVSNGELQKWYTNNFTVVGVDKAAWELRYDEASRALQLRRKGAWSYDEDFAGFKWVEGVSGRWADNSRWDLGRVPASAKNYARFLGTSSYPGYTLEQQIVADFENQDWEIQLLDLSESVNLLFKNGGLTVNENDGASQSVKLREGTILTLDNVRLNRKSSRPCFAMDKGSTLDMGGSSLMSAWDLCTCVGCDTEKDGGENNLVYLHDGTYPFYTFSMTGENGRLRVEDATVTLSRFEAKKHTISVTGSRGLLKLDSWSGESENSPYWWDVRGSWMAADGATITLPQSKANDKIFPPQGGKYAMKDKGKMANQVFVASNGVINASTFYLSDARVHKTADNDYSFVPENCTGNALRIYGKDGAFNASGSVYLGYNGTQAGAPELTFGLPSQAWEKAPLSAAESLELRSSLQLKIDARAVKVTTKFPLASAATLTAANVASTIYDTTKTGNLGANVEITLPDDKTLATCPCALSIEDNTLYLTVEAGEKTSVPVPTIASKVWNGSLQIADIEDCDEYTVEQNAGGSNAGSYDVVLKLTDPDHCLWDDDLGDSDERTVQFLITQAQNEWTTKPGVNPPWWNVGGDPQPGPGTLTAGVAKYGEVSVTHSDNWNGSDMPTTEGSYWIRYAVPENANYSALSERVNFSIYPEGHAPTGDPDDAGYVYTWKYNGAGYWTVPDNWLPEKGATFGYPSAHDDIRATAKFIAQYYDSALTVNVPGDLTTGTIWFDQGAKPVTIDMGGHTLTLVDGVNVTGVNGYGFANGTFGLQTVAFRANGTTLKVQSGTANVSALTFASQEGAATQGATIEADAGGVFAYAGDLSLGTSATTGAGTTLVLAGGQVTATGTLSFGTSTGLDAPSSIAITGAADSGVGLASADAMTIGTTSYVANESPTVAITFPAGGFATAPLRTTGSSKALRINPGTKLALDVSKLEVGTYKIARATGTLTADPTALTANAAFTVRRGTKAVLETSADGKALCVKVTNLGLTLTLVPSEVICDGSSWKDAFDKIVTDSDSKVVEGATFEYRINGGEWVSDLTKSEWINPGVIHVRATVEGYANRPTATFTIKSRGLILFFGPAPAE